MDINLTLIGQLISFALLVLMTRVAIWPKLSTALEAREKTIADGLAAAELGKKSLHDAEERVKEDLDAAKSQAASIIEQAEKRAAGIIDEAKDKAKEEGERLIRAAKSDIEQEIEGAKQALRAQVASIAMAGAKQILGREIDKRANQDILDKLAEEI